MEDRKQGQRDRLGQVEGVAQFRGRQDRGAIIQVGVEVGGAAFSGAGEQRAGVGEHDRYTIPGCARLLLADARAVLPGPCGCR